MDNDGMQVFMVVGPAARLPQPWRAGAALLCSFCYVYSFYGFSMQFVARYMILIRYPKLLYLPIKYEIFV
jgi:hypothetical protein